MHLLRTIRSLSTRGVIAGFLLGALALGCSSGHVGNTGAAGNGGTGTSPDGGTGTGGTGGSDIPPGAISPPFKPSPPMALMSRWSGTIVAEYSENYTFRVTATAPIRALIKGEQILRDWTKTGSRVATGSVWLASGSTYDLEV